QNLVRVIRGPLWNQLLPGLRGRQRGGGRDAREKIPARWHKAPRASRRSPRRSGFAGQASACAGIQARPLVGLKPAAALVSRRTITLVRHRVHDIVRHNPKRQCGELLVVTWIIGIFPRVAQIHVVRDGHHQSALIVVDSAPSSFVPVLFIGDAAAQILRPGNLIPVVQIVDRMENRIAVRKVHNRPVRKNSLHGFQKNFPLYRAVEVIAHEEPAALQIIPHLLDLGIGELPVSDLDRVQPRIVEHVVFVIQVHGLLDRTNMNPRQSAQCDRNVAIGGRVIRGPTRPAMLPISAPKPTKAPVQERTGVRRIHQPREDPFGRHLVIGRHRDVILTRILAPRPLPRQRNGACTQEQNSERNPGQRPRIPDSTHAPIIGASALAARARRNGVYWPHYESNVPDRANCLLPCGGRGSGSASLLELLPAAGFRQARSCSTESRAAPWHGAPDRFRLRRLPKWSWRSRDPRTSGRSAPDPFRRRRRARWRQNRRRQADRRRNPVPDSRGRHPLHTCQHRPPVSGRSRQEFHRDGPENHAQTVAIATIDFVEDYEVYAAIGESGFERLVSAFYRQVPADGLLGPMYPAHDLQGAEQRLRDFLIYRFGGPPRYIE